MKSRLILFSTLLIVASNSYAQFPFMKGKESSGILSVLGDSDESANVLSFDASSTRVAFALTRQDTLLPTRSIYSDYDRNFRKFEIGADLNESTFTVFSKSFQPGIDIGYTWSILRNESRGSATAPYVYNSFSLELNAVTQYINFASIVGDSSDVRIDKVIRTELGINPSVTRTKEDVKYGLKSILSLSVFIGPAFRSTTKKNQASIYTADFVTKTGAKSIMSTDKAFISEPQDFMLIKPKIDLVKRLYVFKSNRASPRFNNPVMHMIFRYSVDISTAEEPRQSVFWGPSLTTSKRQTVTSLIFRFDDITALSDAGVDMSDILTIQLYFGLPLN